MALVTIQVYLGQEGVLQVVIRPDDVVATVDDYLLPDALQLQHLCLLIQLGLPDLLVLGVVVIVDAVQVILVLCSEEQVGRLLRKGETGELVGVLIALEFGLDEYPVLVVQVEEEELPTLQGHCQEVPLLVVGQMVVLEGGVLAEEGLVEGDGGVYGGGLDV